MASGSFQSLKGIGGGSTVGKDHLTICHFGFQSLKGIRGEFDATSFGFSHHAGFVSIPERGWGGIRPVGELLANVFSTLFQSLKGIGGEFDRLRLA